MSNEQFKPGAWNVGEVAVRDPNIPVKSVRLDPEVVLPEGAPEDDVEETLSFGQVVIFSTNGNKR